MRRATGSLDAENTFTDWIGSKGSNSDGYLNVSISGTWAGTITLQRKYDDAEGPFDVQDFTANEEGNIVDMENGVNYRIGFKTGNYTSGTAVVRLSK